MVVCLDPTAGPNCHLRFSGLGMCTPACVYSSGWGPSSLSSGSGAVDKERPTQEGKEGHIPVGRRTHHACPLGSSVVSTALIWTRVTVPQTLQSALNRGSPSTDARPGLWLGTQDGGDSSCPGDRVKVRRWAGSELGWQ